MHVCGRAENDLGVCVVAEDGLHVITECSSHISWLWEGAHMKRPFGMSFIGEKESNHGSGRQSMINPSRRRALGELI